MINIIADLVHYLNIFFLSPAPAIVRDGSAAQLASNAAAPVAKKAKTEKSKSKRQSFPQVITSLAQASQARGQAQLELLGELNKILASLVQRTQAPPPPMAP